MKKILKSDFSFLDLCLVLGITVLLLVFTKMLEAQAVLEVISNTATTSDAVNIPTNAPWGYTTDGRQARFGMTPDGALRVAGSISATASFSNGTVTAYEGGPWSVTASSRIYGATNGPAGVRDLGLGELGISQALFVKGPMMAPVFGNANLTDVNGSLNSDAFNPSNFAEEVRANITAFGGVTLSASNPLPVSIVGGVLGPISLTGDALTALNSISLTSAAYYAWSTTTAGGTAGRGGSVTAIALTGTYSQNVTEAAGSNAPVQLRLDSGTGPNAGFYWDIVPCGTWIPPIALFSVSTTSIVYTAGIGDCLELSVTAQSLTVNAQVRYAPIR